MVSVDEANTKRVTTGAFVASVWRAVVVLAGGTVTGYWLLTAPDGFGRSDRQANDFFERIQNSLPPSQETISALGNTMFLIAATAVAGLILGVIWSWLLRAKRLRLGAALSPLLVAMAVPAIVAVPLAQWAATNGLVPRGPIDSDAGLGDGLSFVALWGGMASIALIPVVGAMLAQRRRPGTTGTAVAVAALSARTNRARQWNFGVPTTLVLVAVATVEVFSGNGGLFALLRDSITAEDATTVFEVTLVLVVAAAIVAGVVELAGGRDESPTKQLAPLVPVRASWSSLIPFLVFLGLVIAAVAGYSFGDDVPAAAAGASPTFGGPWLGADEFGQNILARTAMALGPVIAFSAITATLATLTGLVLAATRSRFKRLNQLIGTLVTWPGGQSWRSYP